MQSIFPWTRKAAAQPNLAYNVDSSAVAHVLTAAKLTGAAVDVSLALTGALAAAANATTDTAADIISAIPLAYVGQTYGLRIINNSSGAFAWTIVAGVGVTVNGTATIAQNTFRDFVVTIATATTVTLQSVGVGTT